MATALTFRLVDNGHDMRLVGTHLDRDIIDGIRTIGVHADLDLKVPETVRAYQLEEEAGSQPARKLCKLRPRSFLGDEHPALSFRALLSEGDTECLELARA
jgi:glycerol-3-phosphate dehydrogenase (NAD(P)+)